MGIDNIFTDSYLRFSNMYHINVIYLDIILKKITRLIFISKFAYYITYIILLSVGSIGKIF